MLGIYLHTAVNHGYLKKSELISSIPASSSIARNFEVVLYFVIAVPRDEWSSSTSSYKIF